MNLVILGSFRREEHELVQVVKAVHFEVLLKTCSFDIMSAIINRDVENFNSGFIFDWMYSRFNICMTVLKEARS